MSAQGEGAWMFSVMSAGHPHYTELRLRDYEHAEPCPLTRDQLAQLFDVTGLQDPYSLLDLKAPLTSLLEVAPGVSLSVKRNANAMRFSDIEAPEHWQVGMAHLAFVQLCEPGSGQLQGAAFTHRFFEWWLVRLED